MKNITLITHYTCTIVANAVENMSLNHNVLCLTLNTSRALSQQCSNFVIFTHTNYAHYAVLFRIPYFNIFGPLGVNFRPLTQCLR